MPGNNIKMLAKKTKRMVGHIVRSKRGSASKPKDKISDSGIGPPSVYHALVVIFLEFFAWGLMTSPIISILKETFPNQTFLMNGLIQGVKGMLSFLAAPILGALSDIWGRKMFLLLSVSFTCCPIPLMKISPWWYFAMISLSGVFAITFSIVFAYVADVTPEEERSSAYGLVSATFAASLVTSPSIGAYLGSVYSDTFVVWLATAIALLDVFFILVFVPESLPEKSRESRHISWENADPFSALRKMGGDKLIMLLCVTVFLSYLPEAGEYSCFFVYLRLVRQFSAESVASFIALVGVLSVISQTVILTLLKKYFGLKQAIMYGLTFEIIQLSIYGFCTQTLWLWTAGGVAAMSSLTYPAISSFASEHAQADEQGVAQGVVTGVRSLCYGLGPALFGLIFYMFDINLNKPESSKHTLSQSMNTSSSHDSYALKSMIPGPPFAFGTILVLLALLVAAFIPQNPHSTLGKSSRRAAPAQESDDKICEAEPLMGASEEAI